MDILKADTNYLYILAAIGYIIYSIIKAGKKVTGNRPTVNKGPQSSPTTVQPPVSTPQRDSGDELKRMLEDLLGGGEEEHEIPEEQVLRPRQEAVQERQQPAAKPRTTFTHKDKPAVHHPKLKESEISPAFVAHPEVVQKAFAEPIAEEENSIDFDIRQAVLYSEILKRPQY